MRKNKQMKKIFIYSLPRAGSTFLQKYLFRNNGVSTISEPWILLPMYYMFKSGKVFSEYVHRLFLRSFSDLDGQGIDSCLLRKEMILAASKVYYSSVADSSAKVFIDKTPRYAIICQDIANDFKDDIHVILFRHPLSCVSSMIKTFGDGNWCLYKFEIDLYLGLREMILLADSKENYKNLLVIRYEDFVSNPEDFYKIVCELANLDPNDKTNLHEKPLLGTLGDPVGEKKFGEKVGNINSEYQWAATFNTIYRKWWAKRLVKQLGEERFKSMGYDIQKTREVIKIIDYSLIQEIKDIPYIIMAFLHRHTGIYVTYVKFKSLINKERTFGER